MGRRKIREGIDLVLVQNRDVIAAARKERGTMKTVIHRGEVEYSTVNLGEEVATPDGLARWEQWVCGNYGHDCGFAPMVAMPLDLAKRNAKTHEVICAHQRDAHRKACEGHRGAAPDPLPSKYLALLPLPPSGPCAAEHAEPEEAVLAVLRGKGQTTLSCPRCLEPNVWLCDADGRLMPYREA